MKFEDALAQMRLGKKITNRLLNEEDVYFQACRVGIKGLTEELPMSIIKMKGDYIHPDMARRDIDDDLIPGTLMFKPEAMERIFNPCKHGNFAQLNLLLVMSEEWEIVE